jgi:hypothetical protein
MLALVGWWAWPSERARIQAALEELAAAASAPAGEAPLASMARAASLNQLLASNVAIVLGAAPLELQGREPAVAASARLSAALAPLDVRVAGADITVQGATARARVTVQVSTASRAAHRFDGEGLLIDLAKPSAQWVVTRITLDQALAKPQ